MVPMVLVSTWLLLSAPVYAPYRLDLGSAAAANDQHLAAAIMLIASLPAFALLLIRPASAAAIATSQRWQAAASPTR